MAKTKAELLAENKLLRRGNIAASVASVLNTLFRCATVVAITGFMYLAISTLAGKQTAADISVGFLGNLTISQFAAYAIAAGSAGLAWRERRLRKKTVERLHPRAQQNERARDPKRTSSRLTKRGDTHPRDAE